MTEFQELVKDAPKFASMERGELVAYAYGTYAEGAKTNAENAKLRELVTELAHTIVKCQNGECNDCQFGNPTGFGCKWDAHMRELGIEVE